MGPQKCLLCLAHLIDPNFNSDLPDAKILCQLLRLPLDYPISSEISSFPDLFESASYCSGCVWKVNAIGHILKDIQELERRLEKHRSEIEEQLKNNLEVTCPEDNPDSNANHLIWTAVVNYIEKSGCRVSTENENDEFPAELDTVDPLEINNEGETQECVDYNPEFLAPSPSPSSHEEKYDPSRDEDLETDEACVSDPIFQNPTPSSGETESLAVSSKFPDVVVRRKRPRPPPKTRCWFAPDCNVRITKDDEIISEAHRLKYHEGVQKCYICKVCNEGFLTYSGLRFHTNAHILNDDVDKSKSMTLTLHQNKKHKVKLGSGIPTRPKRRRAPPRTRCWFEPGCNSWITKDDEICSEAHRLKCHEGVEKCYICKICNEGFLTYVGLRYHAKNAHGQVDSKLMTLPRKKKKKAVAALFISRNCDPEEISEIIKSPFPIIRLTRLDGIPTTAKVKVRPMAMAPDSETANSSVGINRNRKPMPKSKRTHEPIYEENRSTKCPYEGCKTIFRDDPKWQEAHIWKKHESKKEDYLCGHDVCPARFATLEKWHAHITAEHNGGIPAPFCCPFCKLDCGYFLPLRQHVFSVHEPHKAKHKCEELGCGKLFKTRNHLNLHKQTHAPRAQTQRFLCEFCSEAFTSTQRLKYHRTSKHATEANLEPYKCETCGQTYAEPANLRDHVRRVHEKIFKFKCKICGHGAMCKSEFEKHQLRKHKSERPFMCDKCPSTFKLEMDLRQHAKRHVRIRTHKCSICPAAFALKCGLQRHELIHSNAQCHTCTICGRTFPIRNYLTLHMLNFHKIKTNAKKSNLTSTAIDQNAETNEKLPNVVPPEESQNYSTATSSNNEFEEFINL